MHPVARKWAWLLADRARRALFIYVVYSAAMVALQRPLLFASWATHPDPDVAGRLKGLERWTLPVPGGEVEAWLLVAPGASAAHPAPAVIFAHGNGELIDDWAELMVTYTRLGVTVLLPEYRGYGRSSGSPSQEALVDDTARFYERLAARPDVDPTRIVFHGRSVGGGVVCGLSLRHRPAAMVLQSTFASVTLAARRFGLMAFMVRDPFDNEAALRALHRPVLIAHGTRDTTVPFFHAERNAAASGGRLIAYPCGHNDCPPDWLGHMAEVEAFLRQAGVLRAS
jgi:hypothetical protein